MLSLSQYRGPQIDLSEYNNIMRYLGDIAQIESYQRAMQKGDPEMKLMLDAKPPRIGMFEAGGVTKSDHWKK